MSTDNVQLIRLVCHVGELWIGDVIWTPAHMWETVIRIEGGNAFSHSVRVATDETGLAHLREWSNRHRLIVQRRREIAVLATLKIPVQVTATDLVAVDSLLAGSR